MNRRTSQVSSTLRAAVQEVISRGLADPRIRGLITITEVTMSDDLQQATLRVSIYPEERQELTFHGLQAAAAHIRREAGELMAIKRMPALQFRLDGSLKRQAKVLGALAQAADEHEAAPPAPPQAEPDPPASEPAP
ncbi:MAG: 30S ribosome-binding factor RbfA [Phycisphaerales bacterium]|nr:30S ribosome-binding factor RbfA [Phycisphaerales bacterium]